MSEKKIPVIPAVCLGTFFLVAVASAGLAARSDEAVYARVDALMAKMTLEEKVEQLSGLGIGTGEFGDASAGIFGTQGNERLGIPQVVMGHGITGVRSGRDENVHSTYMMTPIGIAASWDTNLYGRASAAVATEMRALHQDLSLGTTLNIIRHPRGGRNWECFSEDPFLTSRFGVTYCKAVQANGIIAGPKHFVANNQERNRFDINNVIGERAVREIYFPAFKAAVMEGEALNIMSAYNRVNGTFMGENQWLLTEVLRNEWGFKGFVLSDFGKGVRSTIPSVQAGLNVEMHNTKYYGQNLINAVHCGALEEEDIDRLVRGKLYAMFKIGLFDEREVPPKSMVHCAAHQALALEVARKAAVLLKNEESILPLDRTAIKRLAVIGPNAKRHDTIPYAYYLQGGGSGRTYYFPDAVNNPADEIAALAGGMDVVYAEGCTGSNAAREKGSDKKEWQVKQIEEAAKRDAALIPEAVRTARNADAVVLVVGLNGDIETEGRDRESCRLPGAQEELIRQVAAVNSNTVVVVVGGSYIDMTGWIDSVKGVLFHFYCGEKIGQAMAEVLFGEVNPTGKLTFSYPISDDQYPEGSILKAGPYEKDGISNVYSEGIFVGYRWFDRQKEPVRFPFGYGLSYTDYKYEGLKVTMGEPVAVELKVTNVGTTAGDEIVQLYVHDVKSSVPRPVRELKGFNRVSLKAGETRTVSFTLEDDAFEFWHPESKQWELEPGQFEIQIGADSRDIRLAQTISVQ